MNGGYKVDFNAVGTAGSDLGTAANNIDQKLGDMENLLRPLQQDWTGEASDAYIVAKGQWSKAINEMKAILQEMGQQVTQDAADAQSNENRNKNRW